MPLDLLEAVDRGDVGMVQRRQRLRFAVEARQAVRIRGHRSRQHLDGDLAREVRVGRAIDLSHSAHANLGSDFIRAEAGTWSHRQTDVIIWGCRRRQGDSNGL